MTDLSVLFAFFAMILSPCLVALHTGVGVGADLGSRDESESRFADSDRIFIPE